MLSKLSDSRKQCECAPSHRQIVVNQPIRCIFRVSQCRWDVLIEPIDDRRTRCFQLGLRSIAVPWNNRRTAPRSI